MIPNETICTEMAMDDDALAERRQALETGLKSAESYFVGFLSEALVAFWFQIEDIKEKLKDGSEENMEKARNSLWILAEANYWIIEKLLNELKDREVIPEETSH